MKIINLAFLICALLLPAFAVAATKSVQVKTPVYLQEVCGKASGKKTEADSLIWDCSELKIKSINTLELSIRETYTTPESLRNPSMRYYETVTPHYTAWIFHEGDKAVRYRVLYNGDKYLGIGITAFCFATKKQCSEFEAYLAKSVPQFVAIRAMPEPPIAPPIYRDGT